MKPRGFLARFSLAQAALAAVYAFSLLGVLFSAANEEAAAKRGAALAAYGQRIKVAALSVRRLSKLSKGSRLAEAEAARREASARLALTRSAARDEVSADESAELDKLSRFVHASGHLLDKIERLRRSGRRREAAALYDSGLKPLMSQYVSSAVSERLRQERAARLEVQRSAELWRLALVACGISFIFLTCAAFLLWTRSAVAYAAENILRAQKAVDALRQGHFRISIEPDRADELGALCTSLKALAARLDQAQDRLDGVTDLANDASRSLNEVIFAVGEYVALARQKATLDGSDEYGLNLILERVGRCNLLLGRLCESVAGQKLLADQSPVVREALQGLSEKLVRRAPSEQGQLGAGRDAEGGGR